MPEQEYWSFERQEPMSVDSPSIVETTQETFERDVVDRSRGVPVVVDFWAKWCGPCRTLGPRLKRLAEEYGGRFVLVKADIERVPDIAAAFGISWPGVPVVKSASPSRERFRLWGRLPREWDRTISCCRPPARF